MQMILDKGHSRIPVYYDKPTNIVGLVLVLVCLTWVSSFSIFSLNTMIFTLWNLCFEISGKKFIIHSPNRWSTSYGCYNPKNTTVWWKKNNSHWKILMYENMVSRSEFQCGSRCWRCTSYAYHNFPMEMSMPCANEVIILWSVCHHGNYTLYCPLKLWQSLYGCLNQLRACAFFPFACLISMFNACYFYFKAAKYSSNYFCLASFFVRTRRKLTLIGNYAALGILNYFIDYEI